MASPMWAAVTRSEPARSAGLRHAQNTFVGACRKVERLHGLTQHAEAFGVGLHKGVELA